MPSLHDLHWDRWSLHLFLICGTSNEKVALLVLGMEEVKSDNGLFSVWSDQIKRLTRLF